jgi:hypothetical protein
LRCVGGDRRCCEAAVAANDERIAYPGSQGAAKSSHATRPIRDCERSQLHGKLLLASSIASVVALLPTSPRIGFSELRQVPLYPPSSPGSSKRLIFRSKGDLARRALPDMLLLGETTLVSPLRTAGGRGARRAPHTRQWVRSHVPVTTREPLGERKFGSVL